MSGGQFAWTLIIQKCPFSFPYAPMGLLVILKYQGFLPGYPFCNYSLVLCSPLLLFQLPFSALGPFQSYIICSPLARAVVSLWSWLALMNSSHRLRIPALRSEILMLDYVSSNCVSFCFFKLMSWVPHVSTSIIRTWKRKIIFISTKHNSVSHTVT